MSSAHKRRPSSPLSIQYITGVYLPSALLLAVTAFVKKEWIPFAAILAAGLGAWTVYSNRKILQTEACDSALTASAEVKKVLKPDVYQEFPLKEKTVLSHNVAMYAPHQTIPITCTDIPSYRFSLPSPSNILGLPIGQHMSIAASIAGQPKEVVRSYTPISSDEDHGFFDLLIKSYPTGNISKHIASLSIGQTLKVKGPKGAMVYTPGLVRHFGMIAGGTGITPMLQIIRAIVRGRPRNGGRDTTKVDLIFANVNQEDILMREDLDRLAEEDEGFRVYYVLNNPPQKWGGGVGFCTPEMIKVWMDLFLYFPCCSS